MKRLRVLLALLMRVNRARLRVSRLPDSTEAYRELAALEAALEQADADGRAKVDVRQLSIFSGTP